MKERGFILRRFLPKKQKCSVFTRYRGKIDLVCRSERDCQKLWPGMQISFTPVLSPAHIYFGADLEILAAPLPIDHLCLELVHHLLELCYYFIPLEDSSENVFNYLECVFIVLKRVCPKAVESMMVRRLCIAGLLSECGFYPPDNIRTIITLFVKEVLGFIDFPKSASVQSFEKLLVAIGIQSQKWLKEWIELCIGQHPGTRTFITLR